MGFDPEPHPHGPKPPEQTAAPAASCTQAATQWHSCGQDTGHVYRDGHKDADCHGIFTLRQTLGAQRHTKQHTKILWHKSQTMLDAFLCAVLWFPKTPLWIGKRYAHSTHTNTPYSRELFNNPYLRGKGVKANGQGCTFCNWFQLDAITQASHGVQRRSI